MAWHSRNRQRETEQQIEQERRIRQAEAVEARLKVESARIQLEQIVAEQKIYSTTPLLQQGVARKPVDELLPVRLGKAFLQQSQANLKLAGQRLRAVEGRRQELKTLAILHEKLEQDRERLKYILEQSMIRAKASGIVLTDGLEQRVGDRIQAGEAILEMAETDEWHARITVQEMDLPKIKTGQPVRLYINAFPHMEYKIFEGVVATVPATPDYFFRIDTDTVFHRPLAELPTGCCYFGHLQEMEVSGSEEKVPFVQGGCIGFPARAMEAIWSSGILDDAAINTRPYETWGVGFSRYMPDRGLISVDKMMGYITDKLGIPAVQHGEIYSHWYVNKGNAQPRHYAVN